MSVPTSEMIGTLRADLRRVEITLGARIDARVAANESWLRGELQKDSERLRAEMAGFREDLVARLAEAREEMREHFDIMADGLRRDIRLIADGLMALEAKMEAVKPASDPR